MKYVIFFLAVFIVVMLPTQSSAQIAEERISDMQVDIFMESDGALRIEESIVYDFGSYERHGIYRTIPYEYERNGARYALRIEDVSVTDGEKNDLIISTSKSGGILSVRIGDPDSYVTGEQEYVISYVVRRAINYFDDHDELYWNAIGTEWEVPIDTASATVHFPNGMDVSECTYACYTGSYGAKGNECTIDESFEGVVTFVADRAFSAFEGMSLVAGFPKGIIPQPSLWENVGYIIRDNWIIVTPFIIWFVMHRIWKKRGKDPKGRGTIVPQYESPLGMRPGELGTLWDERADTKDISATIVDFAVRGYVKIKYLSKKNYEFVKLKEAGSELTPFEHDVWEGVFGTKGSATLESLKNKFYRSIPDIKKHLYDALVERKLYARNPNTARGIAFGLSAPVMLLLFFFAGAVATPVGWISAIAGIVVLIVYSSLMPQKTVRGAEAKEEALGFKWFLSVTEEDRLKFHNAPEKKPEQFQAFLPYAMVFGVEKEWAEQFKDMYIEEPSWYEGQPGAAFTAVYFAGALSHMGSSMNSTLASRPSSSAGSGSSGFGGGGFSGGGFGGGGGGSW